VTFVMCGTSAEAGLDATGDAGTCFYGCAEACAEMKPASLPGLGVCVATLDAGVTGSLTAACETGFICG
jgi:hypothetical protein